MLQIINALYHAIVAMLVIGLLGVGLLFLTSLFAILLQHLGKGKKQLACKKSLFQLYQSTSYQRHPSVSSRKAAEQKACARSGAQPGTAPPVAAIATSTGSAAMTTAAQKPVAVLRFDGDILASDRRQFARLVDEVLVNKDRLTGTIVVVSSPGGGVAQYGQLYAEMERIRKAGIDLTVCVDTFAASGGYLMSLPANRIVAAPFAMVGSIGVVSELINANRFLRNLGLEPLVMTAGKHKRTVTITGEITDEAKAHYQQQLEAIHRQFIKAVTTYRNVDPDKVCTGDYWTAQESVELGLNLVDHLATSQEFLLEVNENYDLVVLMEKKSPFERGVFRFLTRLIDHVIERVSTRMRGGISA